MNTVAVAPLWDTLVAKALAPSVVSFMQINAVAADARRHAADYDTGSILASEACLLRALADHVGARVVIEVGTFIGTSACALASAPTVTALYTCDISNDCFPDGGVIRTFPKQSSTDMLRQLVDQGVRADVCFFDGALTADDIPLLAHVCQPDVVFAVHDYNYGPKIRKRGLMETVPRKGIGNVRLLQTQWPEYRVIDPLPDTTVALFVPESLS